MCFTESTPLSHVPRSVHVCPRGFLHPTLLLSGKQPQGVSYLADQLQGVPGSVPRPDDCQGWLVVRQTEPGWSEILMDPNAAVRTVLVDAGQDHFLLPLQRGHRVSRAGQQLSGSHNLRCPDCTRGVSLPMKWAQGKSGGTGGGQTATRRNY